MFEPGFEFKYIDELPWYIRLLLRLMPMKVETYSGWTIRYKKLFSYYYVYRIERMHYLYPIGYSYDDSYKFN